MWTPELEVNLFNALRGHKPTGINRYFHMACIHQKLITNSENRNVTSKDIWDRLYQMYNLETLNELDELPFNNNTIDFTLPEEIVNPDLMMMSAPSSPTSSSATEENPSRPNKLNLLNIKNNLLSTPESLLSPKRKRNARQVQLITGSQPSSPATPSSSKRRR